MVERCADCQRPYGSAGFPDLIIPNWAWRQISPSGDENGLLCPSCIIARLHISSITCEGAFMSGPVTSVSRELMTTMRWVENLREQGYGWQCPKCGTACVRDQSPKGGDNAVGSIHAGPVSEAETPKESFHPLANTRESRHG